MNESGQRWIPLESNPKYVHGLGADCSWNFVDVYGLDLDMLAMVPQPVAALVLLFPDTNPQDVIGSLQKDYPSDLYYTKQTIGNACGTVAIVHALANNKDQITFDDSKHFKTFLELTSAMSPDERARFLEQDNKMGAAHEDCAQEGDTQVCRNVIMSALHDVLARCFNKLNLFDILSAELFMKLLKAPSLDENVKSHFVSFVHFNGYLYELDGRKDAPVVHGKTSPETFLQDAAEVIQKFMDRDPDNVNFNVMALVNCSDVD